MKAFIAVAALAGFLFSSSAYAQDVEDLAVFLENLPQYKADARFEVLLPNAQDPIVYDIVLQSSLPEKKDSLAPCDYVIRWETMSPSGRLEGFSAYFDGNHYRFRNNRLQEYHQNTAFDAFMPAGPGSQFRGVQQQAQFADMLPQFIGAKLRQITSDTAYKYVFTPDTVVAGKRSTVIEGSKFSSGYEVVNFTYVFDYDTKMPVMFDIENSPGSISEQIVDMYFQKSSDAPTIALTEESLIQQWPDVFEKYRESTFRAESLVGNPLPDFSCQQLGASDRYAHMRGEPLNAPTVIVALDPSVATAASTVDAVREAIDNLPKAVDVIWAFNTNHEGEINGIVDSARPGETILQSASSLIRNCGITLFPTILIANSDGIVTDVIPGYNNDLSSLVIQKSMLIE